MLPLEVEHEEQRTADRLGGTAMLVLLVCCSLVLFSVPAMSYNLFKPSLASNLDLSPSESQAIVSSALVGGMVFGFVPGIIYDRFGYVTTLCYGGIFSCCGALLWFVTLQDGGARDDPSSLTLSLAFAVLSHGCRCMYLAGTCAALRALPPQYTGSVAALLAISVSLGYILLPLAWRNVFMPAPDDENFDPTTQLLANLKPVAHFFLFLAVIYAIATVLGLCLAPLLPPLKAAGRSPGSLTQAEAEGAPCCFDVLLCGFVNGLYLHLPHWWPRRCVKKGASTSDPARKSDCDPLERNLWHGEPLCPWLWSRSAAGEVRLWRGRAVPVLVLLNYFLHHGLPGAHVQRELENCHLPDWLFLWRYVLPLCTGDLHDLRKAGNGLLDGDSIRDSWRHALRLWPARRADRHVHLLSHRMSCRSRLVVILPRAGLVQVRAPLI